MSLIFGLETTFRSLQRNKFASQGRWHIMICIGAALMLTLFTWLPSNVSPSRERCLSSLIWWTEGYAKLGVGIALTLVVAYIVCTTVIAIQLMKTDKVDRDQRIQASTVVYYLIVTTIILVCIKQTKDLALLTAKQCLVLPYYIQIIMQGPAIAVSKVAEVALNITGIIPALLRIFLRSGNDWTMIQARNSVRKTKQQLKIGDSDSDIYDQITSPVSLHACDSQTLLRDPEKCPVAPPMRTPVSETPITHTYVANLVPPPATEPEPHTPPYTGQLTQPTTSSRANYSIFPTTGSATIRESVSTVFSQGEEDLEIPRAPFASGHKRDLSEQSSAMVQIGLRLSSLNHSLDPVQGSPISGSPHISSHSPYSSPRFPQKVLQSCPSSPKSPIKDIAVLPIHPTGTQRPSPGQSPMIGVLAPNWLLRKPSNIDLTLPRREKNTMKTLPPTPPGAVALSPSVKKSPQLTRLTSRHDIPNAPSWC